jgi:hypothetical protein
LAICKKKDLRKGNSKKGLGNKIGNKKRDLNAIFLEV